jgi:hypothetical protein
MNRNIDTGAVNVGREPLLERNLFGMRTTAAARIHWLVSMFRFGRRDVGGGA